ncbi:MAG: hypothetical protein H7256_03605 [Bdellovibrio sp.]|nr:hypothetical protein [Bdellovibrio sp.]
MKTAESKNKETKKVTPSVKPTNTNLNGSSYEEQIPEAQGDLADRANIEIDQEIQEKIMRVRQNIHTVGRNYSELY